MEFTHVDPSWERIVYDFLVQRPNEARLRRTEIARWEDDGGSAVEEPAPPHLLGLLAPGSVFAWGWVW